MEEKVHIKKINISFIIPAYNTEQYILRCIQSILSVVNNINYEIIIIDDGSTDNTYKICNKKYALFDNIKMISICNSGVSKARNLGLDIAKGEWIAFIDSDDFINKQFENILKQINNEIDLVHYSWRYISGNTSTEYKITNNTEYIKVEQLFNRRIFHGYVWSYLFRRNIIEDNKLRFSENLKYAEDWEFILKYYSHIKLNILLISDCLYTQLSREGSITNIKLGDTYIINNFCMYDRVLSINYCIKEYTRLVYFHLYSINIWLVNNVMYKDKTLRKVYRNCLLGLLYKHPNFFSSFIFIAPLLVNKGIYLKIVKLFHIKSVKKLS